MVTLTASSYKPTPIGNYRGKLTKVEEKTNDTGAFLMWQFRLIEDIDGEPVDEEFEIFTVSSSTAFTPNAKARRWVQGMLGGRVLNDDETVDFDEELVGKIYILNVGINNNGRNTLDSISPSKKAKATSNGDASPSEALQRLQAAIDGCHMSRGDVMRQWADLGFKGRTREQLSPDELFKATLWFESLAAPLADTDPSSLAF